jgi:hypothetical protein
MATKLNFTYLILIVVTLVTALVSYLGVDGGKWIALTIMALGGAKFLLVAFQFMELKEAHMFWKFSTVFVCLLIVLVFGLFSLG